MTAKSIIEQAWENRAAISPESAPRALRDAVEEVIAGLDSGRLRVAEKAGGEWLTHQWIKKAVLLSFRLQDNRVLEGGETRYYDKVASKFASFDFASAGVRVVPPAMARRGAYIARNVVLMPSYVNIGAYVDEGTMVDTWATVGSCAQIGRNVHLSGGVGIGGVLEPVQANPVIIEDNCFIGARSEIVEGVIVEENSVISMGVFLGSSTRIYDRASGEIRYGRVPAGSVVVSGNLPSADGRYSLYCAVIVKRVDAKTRAKTSLNELLRGDCASVTLVAAEGDTSMSAMKRLFQVMADKKASDIFFSVGSPINIKINGVAMPVNQTIMSADTIRQVLYEVLTERQVREFEEEMELNTAYSLEGVGAFRISAFRQKGSPAVVVRYIPGTIPPLDSLGLPEVLKEVIMQKRGLILMVGASGAGKSTSLASMLDHRNGLLSGHILTLEDPVEFIFQNRKSIVNQREVGTDTKTFEIALRNALRQAPDCILIGEIRDKQTMAMALAYSQSGHLCLATLHANNSYHAMNRIINFYPLENRPSLLLDLSAALQAVISQRLVRTKTGTRVVAVEILLNTRHIAELIERGEINEIKEALEKSMAPGSQTFEQALFKLFMDGKITQDEAMANADSPTNMLWLINQATAGEITGQTPATPPAYGAEQDKENEKKEGRLSTTGDGASFGGFKIDMNA